MLNLCQSADDNVVHTLEVLSFVKEIIFLLSKDCISIDTILRIVTSGTGTYADGERGLASH